MHAPVSGCEHEINMATFAAGGWRDVIAGLQLARDEFLCHELYIYDDIVHLFNTYKEIEFALKLKRSRKKFRFVNKFRLPRF